PHPVEWPILQEMIARIVTNSFPPPDGETKAGWDKRPLTQGRVMEWLTAECAMQNVDPSRAPRSRGWLSELLKGDLLLASYRQYGWQFLRCKLEDDQMDSDWDLTPNGYFRYVEVEKPEEAVLFSVKLDADQEIP